MKWQQKCPNCRTNSERIPGQFFEDEMRITTMYLRILKMSWSGLGDLFRKGNHKKDPLQYILLQQKKWPQRKTKWGWSHLLSVSAIVLQLHFCVRRWRNSKIEAMYLHKTKVQFEHVKILLYRRKWLSRSFPSGKWNY